ncbi:hypothetical protein FHG87_017028 [Trinorchestia longiramus]|nr:hypothetical protein FHG87_017028 [Trinorchestia longiramus]
MLVNHEARQHVREIQMVKAVVEFWEAIGGMNEPLIDEEPVTLQIGEYDLKIEDKIMCGEIETFLKRCKMGRQVALVKFHMSSMCIVVGV